MTIANAWLEARPAPASVQLTADELADVLRAVETAYEGAWHYSDIGAVPFGPQAAHEQQGLALAAAPLPAQIDMQRDHSYSRGARCTGCRRSPWAS